MQNKAKETRVLVLRPGLLRQFDLVVPEGASTALTIMEPQESLDLLCPSDFDSDDACAKSHQKRLEYQWGELELRLAFFSDIFKWQ